VKNEEKRGCGIVSPGARAQREDTYPASEECADGERGRASCGASLAAIRLSGVRRHGTATRLLLLADTIMSTVTVALRAARRAAATRTFSSSARRREHFLDADATVRALRPILCAC
jgi:hypothetical protein